MLTKFFTTLDRITNYSKQPDGTWHAELHAPMLHVKGQSPNDCRYLMMEELDKLLSEWLVKVQKSPRSRPATSVETERSKRSRMKKKRQTR